MSSKDCGHHDDGRKLIRLILIGVGAFIFVILLIIFLIWAILRPSKPQFILQDATLNAFNLSSSTAPNTLTINMQITLSSHNPNSRIGIYYSSLHAYASYRAQQVTLATELPATYQGHKDFTVWSPFLYGATVPVSPFAVSSLQQDRDAGIIMVNVKVNGNVKWKVGTWISGRYHLFVNCPAYIKVDAGDRSGGVAVVPPAVKFQLLQSCSVDV